MTWQILPILIRYFGTSHVSVSNIPHMFRPIYICQSNAQSINIIKILTNVVGLSLIYFS